MHQGELLFTYWEYFVFLTTDAAETCPSSKKELVRCFCDKLGEVKIWQELFNRLCEIAGPRTHANLREVTRSCLRDGNTIIES